VGLVVGLVVWWSVRQGVGLAEDAVPLGRQADEDALAVVEAGVDAVLEVRGRRDRGPLLALAERHWLWLECGVWAERGGVAERAASCRLGESFLNAQQGRTVTGSADRPLFRSTRDGLASKPETLWSIRIRDTAIYLGGKKGMTNLFWSWKGSRLGHLRLKTGKVYP